VQAEFCTESEAEGSFGRARSRSEGHLHLGLSEKYVVRLET
jgi:hypothetical protein